MTSNTPPSIGGQDQAVEAVARAVRKARFDRSGMGRAYDPKIPLLETDLADARAAIAAIPTPPPASNRDHAELIGRWSKVSRYCSAAQGGVDKQLADDTVAALQAITTQHDNTDLIADLEARDADWQENCNRWMTAASDLGQPMDAETEAKCRLTIYRRAADALQAMTASPREVRLGVWRPISELADLYQQPLMIASPELIHGDKNPLGISEAFWQDDAGDYIGKPGEGAWRCVDYDMCNDEFQTLHLAQDAVSHFLIPEGPWTVEEARALEWDDSARTALGDG